MVTSESPIEWKWKRTLLRRKFFSEGNLNILSTIGTALIDEIIPEIYDCVINYERGSIQGMIKIFTIDRIIKGFERICAFDDRYDSE